MTCKQIVIEDWNRLDKSVKDSKSKNIFKNKLLNKARPKRKLSYYGISDNNKIRYLTMLRLKMSPLNSLEEVTKFIKKTKRFNKIITEDSLT